MDSRPTAVHAGSTGVTDAERYDHWFESPWGIYAFATVPHPRRPPPARRTTRHRAPPSRANATLSINRGLVAVGYDLHETRGKTANARRRIELDPTTIAVIDAWRTWQHAEHPVGVETAGWMFTDADGGPIHPHAISQSFERIARHAGARVIRLHDLRHTHGTLLIAAGVPVEVVSERLGHGHPAFTIETYQHVLPGMQATPPACSNSSSCLAFYRQSRAGRRPGRSGGRRPPEPGRSH